MPKNDSAAVQQQGFGPRLARLRKEAGFTQQELAEQVSVSRRMIAHYEGHAELPPAVVLPRMAKALDLTMEELLGLESKARAGRPTDSRLWRRFKQLEKLPLQRRREVIKVLDMFLEREELRRAMESAASK